MAALFDNLTTATEAYRRSIIPRNPFHAQSLALSEEAPGDDSAGRLTPPPAKHLRPVVSPSLVVFGIGNVGDFTDKSVEAAGSNLISRVGSRGAIIFESHLLSAIEAIADLARSLKSKDGEDILRPRLISTLNGLPASLFTDWVAAKKTALGFSPLSENNVIGNKTSQLQSQTLISGEQLGFPKVEVSWYIPS
ncbi:hypothetical protein ACLKA6_013906 [Drosophila palustris]